MLTIVEGAVFLGALMLYLAPAIIADAREREDAFAVTMVNILLGWTVTLAQYVDNGFGGNARREVIHVRDFDPAAARNFVARHWRLSIVNLSGKDVVTCSDAGEVEQVSHPGGTKAGFLHQLAQGGFLQVFTGHGFSAW
ncbi:hypothetical protein LMG28614_02453 [Paraburkholderia ultramafica]|uniref:Uncharacterized protein n=1 Tax=Paraburkholderia ultramafica TaxID=1544867 RepID=A0A6S7B493_9BURK|nr:hypothetical protein LMG28614_02453 [Paraburkholderia ultramafica]